MEHRIKPLKDFAIKTRDLTQIESTMLTKSDVSDLRNEMHKEFTSQTWRIVDFMLTYGALLITPVFFIARNVK